MISSTHFTENTRRGAAPGTRYFPMLEGNDFADLCDALTLRGGMTDCPMHCAGCMKNS